MLHFKQWHEIALRREIRWHISMFTSHTMWLELSCPANEHPKSTIKKNAHRALRTSWIAKKNVSDQELISRSVHLHCIRDPTYAQIELFLEMCLHCGPYMTEINAENNGGQSEVPHPSSVFLDHFLPFRVDFGHIGTAAETDVRGKPF